MDNDSKLESWHESQLSSKKFTSILFINYEHLLMLPLMARANAVGVFFYNSLSIYKLIKAGAKNGDLAPMAFFAPAGF